MVKKMDRENKVGDDGWAIIANLANGSVSREEMDMCFARTREKMNGCSKIYLSMIHYETNIP